MNENIFEASKSSIQRLWSRSFNNKVELLRYKACTIRLESLALLLNMLVEVEPLPKKG